MGLRLTTKLLESFYLGVVGFRLPSEDYLKWSGEGAIVVL
jgi:hypothetical protein